MSFNFEASLAQERERLRSIEERFGSPPVGDSVSEDGPDPSSEPDADDLENTEAPEDGEAPDTVGSLSSEQVDRLIEARHASEARLPRPLAGQGPSETPGQEPEEDAPEEVSLDGGQRGQSVAKSKSVERQFEDAVLNYQDSSSGPRGAGDAFRRKRRRRGPRVYDLP